MSHPDNRGRSDRPYARARANELAAVSGKEFFPGTLQVDKGALA
ncbi:MAG TPA: hypothetical protein VFN67_04805 [Polyangiales bacterium]|nr:hypothetical protein [Polyangiales bacterium]